MSMTTGTGRFGEASPAVHGRHDLIGSDRVEGTNVYRSDGKKIGEIERVMLDKFSGQVAYAVMGFGGFLGLDEDHYPIPWQRLTYNEKLGGYEVMTISPGSLSGTCPIASDRLVARCRIGAGRATVVADADFLDVDQISAGAEHNLDALLSELARVAHS